MNSIFRLFLFLIFLGVTFAYGQTTKNSEIRELIQQYKNDERGPYRDIRWFCKDGRINPPKEPCGEVGGVQRARYKEEVQKLGEARHIFLGQILSTTPINDFWDAPNNHSRLKQYQLEKYLRAADDGWVNRKAQYYRGAFQTEDEEEWGIRFLQTILEEETAVKKKFYLLRQATKDIPHTGDTDLTQNIRALSKTVAESYAPFMPLRIKIHGQPDRSDIAATEAFLEKHKDKLRTKDEDRLKEMIADMKVVYQSISLTDLNKYVKQLPREATIRKDLEAYINQFKTEPFTVEKLKATCDLLLDIRRNMTEVKGGKERLALLDLSIALEDLLFKGIYEWQPDTQEKLMEKTYALSTAATGCGYLEWWEWERIEPQLSLAGADSLSIPDLLSWHEQARRIVEWSTGMTRAVYRNEVELFNTFEPLAYGFFDDRIRSSVLLPLGNTVSELGNLVAQQANFSNQVLDLSDQSSFRGLNPGYALGELVVVSGSPEDVEVSKEKIYVFHHPASDLKPVAGIATVTEGNMVSHVQLLARNLAIPNAVLSESNLKDLSAYNGQRVFYAVSNKGTVLMKPEREMTPQERQLFTVKQRSEEKVSVPVDQLELENTEILNLRDIDAQASGKLCGPKAANLGQLKVLFPERVVEGIVIPFSIFRQHMDQPLPDQSATYWEFLNNTFAKAATIDNETEAEAFVLGELATFREAIKQIPLREDFQKNLEAAFSNVLRFSMGEIPVFLRSDTNMEDLKDFTGAGLNLTLFNVLEKEKIIQGIRDVWASPYSERSYKWRQKYLLNPENVYPSILIIPGVDVDYSGVLITKGITSGKANDLTIAFSRGVGGAVDGQSAESYLLTSGRTNVLLSPAREPTYKKLPKTGGTTTRFASFERPILNENNLQQLRELAAEVNRILPNTPGIASSGPFDIELGFKNDTMWLFQIRPFVENKNAAGSAYLEFITPKINITKSGTVKKGVALANSGEADSTSITGLFSAPGNTTRWLWGLGTLLVIAVVLFIILKMRKS